MNEPTSLSADDAAMISAIELVEKTEQPKANAPAEARKVYFTDGEKLPWKGQWFTLRLREINGEKLLVLERGKQTAAEEKRQLRAERWLRQHPKSTRAELVRFKNTVNSLQSARSFLQSALA